MCRSVGVLVNEGMWIGSVEVFVELNNNDNDKNLHSCCIPLWRKL